jgi:hypothetical protein
MPPSWAYNKIPNRVMQVSNIDDTKELGQNKMRPYPQGGKVLYVAIKQNEVWSPPDNSPEKLQICYKIRCDTCNKTKGKNERVA